MYLYLYRFSFSYLMEIRTLTSFAYDITMGMTISSVEDTEKRQQESSHDFHWATGNSMLFTGDKIQILRYGGSEKINTHTTPHTYKHRIKDDICKGTKNNCLLTLNPVNTTEQPLPPQRRWYAGFSNLHDEKQCQRWHLQSTYTPHTTILVCANIPLQGWQNYKENA